MTGRHRGGRSLRRRLVVAVLAAGLGRGYQGRHRLAAAALGRPVQQPVVAHAEAPALAAPVTPFAPVTPAAVARPLDAVLITPPAVRSTPVPARLTVVPVATAPDPLTDTVPHPVVTLFPLAADERSADIDAVFADVDAERHLAATVDLATVEGRRRVGRHSA